MVTLSGWNKAILLCVGILAVLTLITASFNGLYGKNNIITINESSGSQAAFINYQQSSQENIKGSEVSFSAINGISLKSSFGLATDLMTILWNFISGGFIEQLIGAMHLGEAGVILALTIRIMWFIGVVTMFLGVLFKWFI